jgi:uroporphyrin-III C-methyltransferase/precorrin-2 dehydrogenase/sirohydrochlorin ferrochelatase
VVLVIAASGERALDREVARDAQARQLPVNVVDDPAACSVIMPALVDRSPILIAIGSGGSAPVLSRLVRGQIEALLPQALAELGRLAAAVRGEVQRRLPDLQERRRFWEDVFEGEVAELALRGELARAEQTVRELLAARSGDAARPRGVVYLVGAGPNDPELVSLRALRCLQRADRVLWAPGVSETVVDLCRRDARRAPLAGWPLPDPDVVSQLTAATTRDGQRACVLAPGDAFRQVEGRDFADVLERAGITCVVVPGVM